MLREAIRRGSNEKYLEVYLDEVKGRCVRSLIEFSKGDFVVEYKGQLIHQLSVLPITHYNYTTTTSR